MTNDLHWFDQKIEGQVNIHSQPSKFVMVLFSVPQKYLFSFLFELDTFRPWVIKSANNEKHVLLMHLKKIFQGFFCTFVLNKVK